MPSVRLSHLGQVPLSLFAKSVFSREPLAGVGFKGAYSDSWEFISVQLRAYV